MSLCQSKIHIPLPPFKKAEHATAKNNYNNEKTNKYLVTRTRTTPYEFQRIKDVCTNIVISEGWWKKKLDNNTLDRYPKVSSGQRNPYCARTHYTSRVLVPLLISHGKTFERENQKSKFFSFYVTTTIEDVR